MQIAVLSEELCGNRVPSAGRIRIVIKNAESDSSGYHRATRCQPLEIVVNDLSDRPYLFFFPLTGHDLQAYGCSIVRLGIVLKQ